MVISTERVHRVITRLPDGIGVPCVLMAKITPSDFSFSNFFCGHAESTKCRSFWSSCQRYPLVSHEREQEGKRSRKHRLFATGFCLDRLVEAKYIESKYFLCGEHRLPPSGLAQHNTTWHQGAGRPHIHRLSILSIMAHPQQPAAQTFTSPPLNLSPLSHANQPDFSSQLQIQRLRQDLAHAQKRIQEYEDLSTHPVLFDKCNRFMVF